MAEKSDKGSTGRPVDSSGAFSPALWPEAILAVAGSLGGGGRGDLIFPALPGGGARSVPTFGLFEGPPVKPAVESMPPPLDVLFFTFMRMVSPS